MGDPIAQVVDDVQTVRNFQDAVMMPERTAWTVTDRSSAAWAIQKVYEVRQAQERRKAEAERLLSPLLAQVDLINVWLKKELADLDDEATFFEGHLFKYLAHERAADPKLKSIKLPHGTIASRQKPDGIEIADEKALLALAKANGWTDMVRIKEELEKSRIKEAVLKEGQVIDGVRKVEGDLVYEVRIAEVAE